MGLFVIYLVYALCIFLLDYRFRHTPIFLNNSLKLLNLHSSLWLFFVLWCMCILVSFPRLIDIVFITPKKDNKRKKDRKKIFVHGGFNTLSSVTWPKRAVHQIHSKLQYVASHLYKSSWSALQTGPWKEWKNWSVFDFEINIYMRVVYDQSDLSSVSSFPAKDYARSSYCHNLIFLLLSFASLSRCVMASR